MVQAPTKIDHFSEGLEECKEFLLNFDVQFGSNPSLSDSMKMYHLRNHLKGEAKDFIQDFPPNGSHYHAALAALKEHFAPEAAVVSHYTGKILSADEITDFATLSAFNRLVIRCVRHLKSENIDPGRVIMTLVADKIAPEIHRDIANKLANHNLPITTALSSLPLDKFMELLQEETDFLRQTTYKNCYKPSGKPTGKTITALPSTVTEATSLPATQARSHANTTPSHNKCVYCSGTHAPNNCDKVPNADTRFGILVRKKLCTNCLRPGHNQMKCRAFYSSTQKKACGVCNNRHHTSLHAFFRPVGNKPQ